MHGFELKRSRVVWWRSAVPSLSLLVCVGACQDVAGPSPQAEAGLAVSVAPLDLEQIGFACYDLEVLSIQSVSPTIQTETVWRRGDFYSNRADDQGNFAGDSDTLCSNVFGNGPSGDILYVGTCDATYAQHIVRLVVDGLYKPSGGRLAEGADWLNPCPTGEPCEFYADCRENADTPVTINLTVIRSANQGFFDIGVRFDEIFCSSKVDCSYNQGYDAEGNPILDPIMLVHGADGEPKNTAVIGFACTAGPGDEDLTELYMNAPRVECGSVRTSAQLTSQFFCQPGASQPELVGYAWFQLGRKTQGGFQLDASEFEAVQWTPSGFTWAATGTFPTTDSTYGQTYDAVAPVMSLGPDRMLAYGVIFGVNPFGNQGGDLSGIARLHVGTLSRAPGSQQWTEFNLLPGTESEDLFTDVARDTVSGQIVVQGVSADGMGYLNRAVYLFAPDGAAVSGFVPMGVPFAVPAGVEGELQTFISRTLLSYVNTDWNAPTPLPVSDGYRAALSSWPSGDSVQVDLSSINAPLSFTDASGNIWGLTSIANGNTPTIIEEGVLLVDGQWYAPSYGYTSFPVVLQMNDLGGGDYELVPSLVPVVPALTSLQGGFSGYVDYNAPRAVRWSGQVPAGSQFQYVTAFTNLQAPYNGPSHDPWNTWKIPNWNGNQVNLRGVIEGLPGQSQLIIGQSGGYQPVSSSDPCDPTGPVYNDCTNPPMNNGWYANCIENTPGVGTCQYYVYLNESVFGFLGATADATDVTWVGPIAAPAGSIQTEYRGVRETASGRELLFEHYSNLPTYTTAQTVTESGTPTLGQVHRLDSGTFDEVYVTNGQNNHDSRYESDVRTRQGADSCSRVYVGEGYPPENPAWADVSVNYSAAWNLAGPSTADNNPPGVLAFNPVSLEPSAGFMSAMDAAITAAANGQGYYVLPLDIPEGYAWDTINNTPDPGVVFQYGVYYGEEELMCGDEPCNKKYFNVAIGIDPSYTNCVLAFEATAAQPGVISAENGWQTPVGGIYPVVVARVNLTPDIRGGSSAGVCGENPLNGSRSGVQTMYTHGTDDQGFPFCYHLDVDGETVYSHCDPDYDYSAIDSNPIFGRSRGIDLGGGGGPRGGSVPVQGAPLTYDGEAIGIGQFESAYPDCIEGMLYDSEHFACVGVCGDGVETSDEACDDGNQESGDGCDASCRFEVLCGDGITRIPADALCDGHNDCTSAGISWDERPSLCGQCKPRSLSGSSVVFCDGVVDCPDRRDEALCAPAVE